MAEISRTVNRALESVQAGWRALVDKSSSALTRFLPGGDEKDSAAIRSLRRNSPGWGLLAAELQESANSITVKLEISGMEPEQFDISVEGNQLIVSGEKQVSRDEEHGNYHLTERAYGSFQRILELPAEVDIDEAKAKYRRGVLTINLPKHASARSKKIPVRQS